MDKIIFFDFDDTLYSHKLGCIPESTIEAIRKLDENGIITYLCTGRSIFELEQFDLDAIPFTGMIASNGQSAYNRKKEIVYENPFDDALKERILKMFNERKIALYLLSDHNVFINFYDDFIVDLQNSVKSPMPELKEYEGEKIYLASCFYHDEKEKEVIKELSDVGEITFWWVGGGCDVVKKGSSKASGIKAILDYHHISPDDAICFGDGENDIDMLKYCGLGIAMGNADDAVKKAADYVADDIVDDGISKALKHFGFI